MNATVLLLIIFALTFIVALPVFLFVVNLFAKRRAATTVPEGQTLATRAAAAEEPRDWEGRVDRAFDRAVARSMLGIESSQATAFIALAGIALATVFFFVFQDWLVAGFGFLIGVLAASAVFYLLQARWRQQIQDQLPDALFLLARSLRSGMALDQALLVVARYTAEPLGRILHGCAREIELGVPAADTVSAAAETVQLADFDALAMALQLHRTAGGNLPTMLDRLATSTRDRNLFRGYYETATSLPRLSAYFLALTPVLIPVFMYFWQPEYVSKLFTSPLGWGLVLLAVVLEIIGLVWVTWLLRRVEF